MSTSILVLGATGPSGLAFIEVALRQPSPPKLTLLVRPTSRGKLPAGIESQTRIVEGGLTDERALLDAMDGVDTVVSFLGAYPSFSAFIFRNKETPVADSFKGIIAAMRAKGAKRIFALSTPSFSPDPTESFPTTTWALYSIMPKIMVPQGNAEMVGIAKAVAAVDDLDWTVFRVPHLTENAADLPVAAGNLGPDFKGTIHLSRASMAVWILKEMEERKWVKKAPVLGNY
ncbi:hypothetical protein DFH09DRAFT_207462 [Mycena vulgaris]|nr:hypothetical protein DFH09DRAFT_207462 [Mycena vulgaris]